MTGPDQQAVRPPSGVPTPRVDHLHGADIAAERAGWYELLRLVRSLTTEECLEPGYYNDPDWTVRDVAAHLGTWLAEAEVQFERMTAGTYQGQVIDVDALNATFLEAMAGQPWEVAWIQANAGRSRMLETWYGLADPSAEADWWIRKSGAEHFAEHLPRLREWVAELIARRPSADRQREGG
jgi:Mycothiol maleylpyruvate isomerase N-terminal domain